jgi:hypothetical protein
MNRLIFLLLIIINMPFCSWAEEDKLAESKNGNAETKNSKQKAQAPEVKDIYLKLFQTGYITQEDLEKSKLPIQVPAKEIIVNNSTNTYGDTAKSEPLPEAPPRNQFLERVNRIERDINKDLGREASKGVSFIPHFPENHE